MLPQYVRDALDQLPDQLKPGTVHVATVQHDDGCEIFEGKPCNCEPTTTTAPVT